MSESVQIKEKKYVSARENPNMKRRKDDSFLSLMKKYKEGKGNGGTECFFNVMHLYELESHVKQHFPVNGVPEHIEISLGMLLDHFEICEQVLEMTVESIISEVEKQGIE